MSTVNLETIKDSWTKMCLLTGINPWDLRVWHHLHLSAYYQVSAWPLRCHGCRIPTLLCTSWNSLAFRYICSCYFPTLGWNKCTGNSSENPFSNMPENPKWLEIGKLPMIQNILSMPSHPGFLATKTWTLDVLRWSTWANQNRLHP